MTIETREITDASLSVAWDLGHGGTYSVYRVKRTGDDYEVSVTTSRGLPRPGESRFRPSEATGYRRKESREVAEFLGRLSVDHRVFELKDLVCPDAFLHPTFYRFHFGDSRGSSYGFEYSVEAGRHHSDTYRRLVEEFKGFFESEEVSHDFPERDKRAWWKFW